MRHHKKKLCAAALAMLALAAGCGSTRTSTGSQAGSAVGSSAGSGSHTYTIGVLTDITGPASSGNKSSVQGVEAGIAWAASNGYHFKYVVADTQTSPTAALSAAQKLVEQDHVFAVVADSALTFAAANYLTQHKIPVIGFAEDSSEWQTATNMFSVTGALHTNQVATTFGQFFHMEGVTNLGTLGYSISPASSEAAKAASVSAGATGIKTGYLNASFAFGSTNVEPVALAMKSAGVDGFTAATDPNTAFALITALRQLGVNLKAALLATGYGGDLLQGGPGAVQEAQNVYFGLGWEPIEMHTAATEQFANALKSVGVNGDPTVAEYAGYTSVLLLVQGLQGAGSNPSRASLISGLSGIHSFSAGGLYGTHTLDINNRTGIVSGVDNCYWVTQLAGSTFKLVNGADPICGTVIAGKTVSPSS
jgi:ABC-type branched-subunit amino acid transport system substrate-binding protein